MNQRQKDHGFAIGIILGDLMGDLAEVRLQRSTDLVRAVIAIGHTDVADIQLQRDHLRFHRAQIFLPNRL